MPALLSKLSLEPLNAGACTGPSGWISEPDGHKLTSFNPTTGDAIASVMLASPAAYDRVVDRRDDGVSDVAGGAGAASVASWSAISAARCASYKEPLGDLVSLEMGKIRAEGHGEVQEMIDICDFAVGLSRQLYGLTIASERPGHRMMEQWHPLGAIGVITAFNFPVAVWSWNAAIAAVCGDTVIWKPAEPTPLTAVAVQHIANRVMADHGVDRRVHAHRRVGADHRRGDAARSAAAAHLVHGIDGDRTARGPDGGRTLRPDNPRARRQQRDRRDRRRQPGPGGARDPVRRGRHCRAALHLDAPDHRARQRGRTARRAARARLRAGADRRSARRLGR